MFEFVFTVWILTSGSVAGSLTIQTKTPEMCETLQQSMVEDSMRIPADAPIQTLVGVCIKRSDS